ncbi:MAG: glycosyltransferase family 1 protein [Nitrospiraceae bacterium]|nr:MAG: glycosyltransferase family 1 protein [Nitrospiraceae bacterium]
MKILLIGNFAPPFEEENLHNLSFLKKLEDEGHECSVINNSSNPSMDKRFVDTKNYIDFVLKLLRLCRGKDVVHFHTKGYLRLGLLKLMTSILVGKIFRAKAFITIHSELFSIQGQMRSPVGGRQTLFTAFTFADRIICSDRDTYNVASMYMRKSNFELIPSFIYIPDEIKAPGTPLLKKLKDKKKVIVFLNVKYPSFLFEILREMASTYPLPSEVGLVISFSEKPSSKFQHVLEEAGKEMLEHLIFVEQDDLKTTLAAYDRANIIMRPLSCDGTTFFESFSISVKKTMHAGDNIYSPSGLIFVKEGETAEMCACIINTMLCLENGALPELKMEDSFSRIKKLYGS